MGCRDGEYPRRRRGAGRQGKEAGNIESGCNHVELVGMDGPHTSRFISRVCPHDQNQAVGAEGSRDQECDVLRKRGCKRERGREVESGSRRIHCARGRGGEGATVRVASCVFCSFYI